MSIAEIVTYGKNVFCPKNTKVAILFQTGPVP